jgi:hypothetical protein
MGPFTRRWPQSAEMATPWTSCLRLVMRRPGVRFPEPALSQRLRRTRPLDAGLHTVAAADALTTKVREGGRVNVHTSVATGVSARARTGSPVPIGGESFRQGGEHGHSRFWPLLQYGV